MPRARRVISWREAVVGWEVDREVLILGPVLTVAEIGVEMMAVGLVIDVVVDLMGEAGELVVEAASAGVKS